jgi:hypothetical protein
MILDARALTRRFPTGPGGAFELAIPPSAALAEEASKNDGWVNLFIYAVNSNGSMTLFAVPLKQNHDGGFAPTYFDHAAHPINVGCLHAGQSVL